MDSLNDKKLYHKNYNREYYIKNKFRKVSNMQTLFKKNDISPTKFYIKIETPNDKNDLFLVL